ncbi:MAG: ribonuclease E/G [Alphaproteobacteria bacterium]|nr:ribonuclease E/G [Alphaproteobacteria bacterium]
MTKRMLIDATHEEETRVAVMDNNRLVDFDYESQFRKPLKGNIFLAKVTRVEPSLQAAFVNFGGNRHGFLPFSEIHPDYFRIPIADREALLAEQEAALAEAEAQEEAEEAAEEAAMADGEHDGEDQKSEGNVVPQEEDKDEPAREEAEDVAEDEAEESAEEDAESAEDAEENGEDGDDEDNQKGRRGRGRNSRNRRGGGGRANKRSRGAQRFDDNPERRFRYNLRRKYKIQEVIKRGQIMLVQVSKEERGNKGAAVGSYLSLPGRYCVLMPNSPRAGGVSRKIANFKDRKRMREIMKELEVPKGMSVILRTAGLERTKVEIKRDLDYLIKLWNNIRELTLESSAPALVYEEADLIKRAVRDLYTRDVEEIIVAGEEGFKNARNFMKMMIPSHAKRIQEYKQEGVPLFNKYKVESQIAEIGETQVTLPSGGYLVINPTEALVSVDVNSGKSTKERHIEETALRTNLEAAAEVARQLRLRDLGGLVVIDFIDMEDRRNNGKVERKMREALSNDRARVQVGRISNFGLMELSRQRLSPSLTESQFETCQHCSGTGRIRTADATTIMVLRALEDEGIKGRAAQVAVHVSSAVAVYILNNKRSQISSLEERYGFEVLMRVDESVGSSGFRVEVSRPVDKDEPDDQENGSSQNSQDDDGSDDERSSRGGRRRGRRGGRNRRRRDRDDDQSADNATDDNEVFEEAQDKGVKDSALDDEKAEKPKKSSGRGRKKDDEKTGDEKSSDDSKSKKKPAAKKSEPKSKDSESKKNDKKEETKSSNKDSEKDSADKKKSAKKAPSNDDKAKAEKPAPKEYETVNQAPDEKKKGWWSR